MILEVVISNVVGFLFGGIFTRKVLKTYYDRTLSERIAEVQGRLREQYMATISEAQRNAALLNSEQLEAREERYMILQSEYNELKKKYGELKKAGRSSSVKTKKSKKDKKGVEDWSPYEASHDDVVL